jgi:hypothetical protein
MQPRGQIEDRRFRACSSVLLLVPAALGAALGAALVGAVAILGVPRSHVSLLARLATAAGDAAHLGVEMTSRADRASWLASTPLTILDQEFCLEMHWFVASTHVADDDFITRRGGTME